MGKSCLDCKSQDVCKYWEKFQSSVFEQITKVSTRDLSEDDYNSAEKDAGVLLAQRCGYFIV